MSHGRTYGEQRFSPLQQVPTKNLAAELLSRLMADLVKSRSQKNAMQGKEFTDRLRGRLPRAM